MLLLPKQFKGFPEPYVADGKLWVPAPPLNRELRHAWKLLYFYWNYHPQFNVAYDYNQSYPTPLIRGANG